MPPGLGFDQIDEAVRQWVEHGWHAAAPGMALVTSTMRMQQLFQARVDEVLRPFELTFARYEALMVLSFSRRGAMPLSRLGIRLQVHPTSVTNTVDRLEGQQLVRRVPHDSDRRATLAEILPAGRAVAAEATETLNPSVFESTGLSPEETRRLLGLLRKLRASAGDVTAAS